MTKYEAIELFRGIASRLVGLLGVCLVLGVLSFAVVEIVTTQPKASAIATMDPDAKSETYIGRYDSESFIMIATDGKKTITHIDSKRLTWLVAAALSGIGLFLFRWPLAGVVIPKSISEQAAASDRDKSPV